MVNRLYNEYFIEDYDYFVEHYQLNIHGANIDPSLGVDFKPDDGSDPAVNSGLDLSAYFTKDLKTGGATTQEQVEERIHSFMTSE